MSEPTEKRWPQKNDGKNGRCFYVTEVPRGRSDPGWRYRKHHGGRGCEAPVDPKKQVPSGYGSRRLGPKPMFYIVLYYFTQIYSVRLGIAMAQNDPVCTISVGLAAPMFNPYSAGRAKFGPHRCYKRRCCC
jgi:hypothetical protein